MLEELFNLVKGNAQDAVINNPAIPNEQNEAVVASATHSVAEELQGTLAGGGLQNVLSLFGGNSNEGGSFLNNPIVSNIISNFKNKLTNDHGIASDKAGGIAQNLIPGVLNNLINRTNDPSDKGFDINSIIGSLTGGGTSNTGAGGFDLNGIMSKFTGGGGLDTDGDGKIELSDIVSKVTGGAQQAQTGGGGGLMDMIKGFIK